MNFSRYSIKPKGVKVMKKLIMGIIIFLISITFVSTGCAHGKIATVSTVKNESVVKSNTQIVGFSGKVTMVNATTIGVKGKNVAVTFDAKNPKLNGYRSFGDVKIGDTVAARYTRDGIMIIRLMGHLETKVSRTKKVTKVKKTSKEEAVCRMNDYIRDENVDLEDGKLRIISERVYDESRRYKVDYRLVLALMKIESNFRHDAVSKKGARGLLQVKPSLAKHIAEDVGVKWRGNETLHEPEENIKIGVHAFSKLIQDFQCVNMALHAYHVGPTKLKAILTENKAPKKRYVNLVLDEYDRNISRFPAP